jgi:uncharacterized protein
MSTPPNLDPAPIDPDGRKETSPPPGGGDPTPGPAAPTLLTPVSAGERIACVDVLRGVAVLGILVINIWSFALPGAVLFNPPLAGGFSGWDFAAWLVAHLFFQQKMVSIFSMLFGAGLVLLTERADTRGQSLVGIYYRRVLWLLAFGLAHAYLLWEGDILYTYAVCGLVLYPFRRLAPKVLILLGLALFLLPVPTTAGLGWVIGWMRDHAASYDEAVAAGRPPTEQEQAMHEAWTDARSQLAPTPRQLDEQIALYRDGYGPLFWHRAGQNVGMQTYLFVLMLGPFAGGLMLFGMALMKLGVFSAARPTRFYVRMAAIGYAVGLPVAGYGVYDQMAHGFDLVYGFLIGQHFNHVASLFVALGHVGVVMLVCQAGALPWLTSRLAAVGRLALTNYLLQSLFCTTLFYGWGFGFFGHLNRAGLVGVVAAVWLLQLVLSPLWLRSFRFGPMEWLWRSLTYGQLQPMRRVAEDPCPQHG